MRLLDIKRLVTIAHEKFDLKFTSNNGGYYIENILESQKAIKALYDSGIYEFNETSINALTELLSSFPFIMICYVLFFILAKIFLINLFSFFLSFSFYKIFFDLFFFYLIIKPYAF